MRRESTNDWMNESTNKQTNKQINKQTNEQSNQPSIKDEREMTGSLHHRKFNQRSKTWRNEFWILNEWMNKWMNEWMMNEWINEYKKAEGNKVNEQRTMTSEQGESASESESEMN